LYSWSLPEADEAKGRYSTRSGAAFLSQLTLVRKFTDPEPLAPDSEYTLSQRIKSRGDVANTSDKVNLYGASVEALGILFDNHTTMPNPVVPHALALALPALTKLHQTHNPRIGQPPPPRDPAHIRRLPFEMCLPQVDPDGV
jgi:hypothetical protein